MQHIASEIDFALAENVGFILWLQQILYLAVERAWLALGGPFLLFAKLDAENAIETLFLAVKAVSIWMMVEFKSPD